MPLTMVPLELQSWMKNLLPSSPAFGVCRQTVAGAVGHSRYCCPQARHASSASLPHTTQSTFRVLTRLSAHLPAKVGPRAGLRLSASKGVVSVTVPIGRGARTSVGGNAGAHAEPASACTLRLRTMSWSGRRPIVMAPVPSSSTHSFPLSRARALTVSTPPHSAAAAPPARRSWPGGIALEQDGFPTWRPWRPCAFFRARARGTRGPSLLLLPATGAPIQPRPSPAARAGA